MLPPAPTHALPRSLIFSSSCLHSLPTLPCAHNHDLPSQFRPELPNCKPSPAFPWQERDFEDFPSIAALLRRLGESKDLLQARQLHAFLRKRGYDYSTFIGNSLVQMYGNCGSIADARAAYDAIQSPNLHSWNILIQAYALNGHFEDAITVFESMPKRDVVSWTAIISSAVQHGFNAEALAQFCRMQSDGIEPNSITFASVLEACTIIEEGFELHSSIVKRGFDANVVVATALITMYGNCNSLLNARHVFSTIPEKNVVSWTAMMTALTVNGRAGESVEAFYQMSRDDIVCDQVVYVCALNACASLGALKEGQDIHASVIADGFERDVVVGNALVTMYGKSGDLDSAIIIFMKVAKRDAISWTAIISACAQNGYSKEALHLFNQMKLQGFHPQIATYVSVLDACSDLIALEKAREAHLDVTKNGSEVDLFVRNSLINLYGKSGNLDEARSVFVNAQQTDVISWNSIISACAQNARGMGALGRFGQMENEGIEPDNATFICAIEACISLGAVKEGRQTHATTFLYGGYEMDPSATRRRDRDAADDMLDRYTCMVDLLGHAGHLPAAEDLLNSIPNVTRVDPWLSLLCACRLHSDVERGERAANRCLELDPENASPYVELTRMYSAAGSWEDAAKAREALENFTELG